MLYSVYLKATMNEAGKYFENLGINVDDKLVLITAHRRENHG